MFLFSHGVLVPETASRFNPCIAYIVSYYPIYLFSFTHVKQDDEVPVNV